MKKIIYSAKDSDGDKKHGFVEARSNSEALSQLADMGLSHVTLHDDAFTAFEREDLKNFDEKELERVAKFEIKIRSKGSGLNNFIFEVIRANKVLIICGMAIFILGLIGGNYIAITCGALLVLSMPVLALWNYRSVSEYDRLIKSSAIGDWDESLRCITKLRPHMIQPEMAFDLDIREACIVAEQNSLAEGLSIVEKWFTHFNDLSPGIYESRISAVYHAAGDYLGFLNKMQEGYLKSSESPTMIVDLALAEARFGDIEVADSLILQVNKEELPPLGLPFVYWVKGLIAKRRKDSNAIKYLGEAASSMSEFGENPAIWTGIAVCTGTYASALVDNDELQKAEMLIKNVWEILRAHGDIPLLKELSEVSPVP